jgi:hypothetical protein
MKDMFREHFAKEHPMSHLELPYDMTSMNKEVLVSSNWKSKQYEDENIWFGVSKGKDKIIMMSNSNKNSDWSYNYLRAVYLNDTEALEKLSE